MPDIQANPAIRAFPDAPHLGGTISFQLHTAKPFGVDSLVVDLLVATNEALPITDFCARCENGVCRELGQLGLTKAVDPISSSVRDQWMQQSYRSEVLCSATRNGSHEKDFPVVEAAI